MGDSLLENTEHRARVAYKNKQEEMKMVDDLVVLIDLPSSPETTPENPTPDDIEQATSLLQRFQLSDYKCLIEERQLNERCAYVMCPVQTPRKLGSTYVASAKSMVPWAALQTFCSSACAARSKFLLRQFIRNSPWDRQGRFFNFEYLIGDIEAKQTVKFNASDATQIEQLSDHLSDIDIQDQGQKPFNDLMSELVFERESVEPPQIQHIHDYSEENAYDAIEGYRPGSNSLFTKDPLDFMD